MTSDKSIQLVTPPNLNLRRMNTEPALPFFTPSSTSFNPRPYLPHSSQSVPRQRLQPTSTPVEDHIAPPADPSPSDPDAIFIHPPFTSFPGAHLFPEGLCYNIMAMNPEWFLDPYDYISSENNNPAAISYPSFLEPPRGWCPIKKKDSRLRSKNSGVWQEGEEPRLRCTFCRRNYAGVNAKSMWRRHVFEKHKIAMSNKRDSTDRFRHGRMANKENGIVLYRQPDIFKNPAAVSGKQSPKAKLSTTGPQRHLIPLTPSTSFMSQGGIGSPQEGASPATPQRSTISCAFSTKLLISPFCTPDNGTLTLSASSPAVAKDHDSSDFLSSPYDPTQTPAFKHYQSQLPCNQPWRFPSPSHPLHTTPKELCLGIPVDGVKGDGLQSTYISSAASPLVAPSREPTNYLKLSDTHQLDGSPLLSKMTMGKLKFERRTVSDSDLEPRLGKKSKRATDLIRCDSIFSSSRAEERESVLTDDDVFSVDSNFTIDSIFRSPEDPLDIWLNLEDSETRKDSGEHSSYKQPPMLRTVDLPRVGTDEILDSNTKYWLPQASGLGLGLRFGSSPHEDGMDDRGSFSFEEFSGPTWRRSRKVADSSSLQRYCKEEIATSEAKSGDYGHIYSPSSHSRKRKTIDV